MISVYFNITKIPDELFESDLNTSKLYKNIYITKLIVKTMIILALYVIFPLVLISLANDSMS